MPELIPAKKILISPLDWGLGHASRIIPIIKILIFNNAEVIIAADGPGYDLLKIEFPELKLVRLSFPTIKYSQSKYLVPGLLIHIPRIVYGIIKEHQQLQKIIQSENINIVISDNRYGLWNKNIFSVFITHQLMIKMPWYLRFMEYPIHKILLRFIRKYDLCWIPDFQDNMGLSGDLSHKYVSPPNSAYIGPLTRFKKHEKKPSNIIRDLLVILSGPEPQRTILENILTEQIKNTKYRALIIRGLPSEGKKGSSSDNITYKSYLPSDELLNEISISEIIICRSGYSSVMDLYTISKKAILIPTPGQTEQEYIAMHLYKKKMFYFSCQKNFDLNISINFTSGYNPEVKFNSKNTLESEIKKLLSA